MKLTTKQAAERAGVSVSMIYQWCQERLFPHYRCGRSGRRGKILVEDSDLDAFLAGCKVEVREPEAPLPPLKHIRL
jgi:excisionase family DNA binding protein